MVSNILTLGKGGEHIGEFSSISMWSFVISSISFCFMENLGPLISMVEFLLDFVLYICINVFSTSRSGFMLLLHVNLDGWCNPYPPNLTWSWGMRNDFHFEHVSDINSQEKYVTACIAILYHGVICNGTIYFVVCTAPNYIVAYLCAYNTRWKKIALFGHLDSLSHVWSNSKQNAWAHMEMKSQE